MSSEETTIEQARAKLGDLVIAAMNGQPTTITRYGRPAAMLVPYAEEPAVTTTYTRTTDEGTETTEVIRDGEQVREVYTVDGEVCDDSIVCHENADEYLRGRDMELRSEGYELR